MILSRCSLIDYSYRLPRDGQTLGRRFVEIDPSSRSDYYDAIVNVSEASLTRSAKGEQSWFGVIQSYCLLIFFQQHLQGRHVSAGTSLPDELSAADDHRSIDDDAMTAAALWGTPPIDTRGPPPYGGRYHGGTVPVEGPGAPLPNHRTEGHRGGLHAPVQKRTGGGLQVGEHTGFLRMRGLPFSAAKEDILEFFREYNPVPESIVLTYRNDGRATGEAYVGFTSAEDSRRAMELHRRMIGSRYIELFISNKDEQGRALTRFGNR